MRIYIEDLEVFACHGVLKQEKTLPQKFLVTVELGCRVPKSDDIAQAVDYSKVCQFVENFMLSSVFCLIETCAHQLCEALLVEFAGVREACVTVKKPWAPIKKRVQFVAAQFSKAWQTVFIGLGSNLGERETNIKKALALFETSRLKVRKVSEVYETAPVGGPLQGNYLNCVAEAETLLGPAELMNFLLGIEQKLGRKRTVKNGPRTLDLDILLFADEVINSKELTVPHPRMHERLFVLAPLCDLSPEALHPVLKDTVYNLKAKAEEAQPGWQHKVVEKQVPAQKKKES